MPLSIGYNQRPLIFQARLPTTPNMTVCWCVHFPAPSCVPCVSRCWSSRVSSSSQVSGLSGSERPVEPKNRPSSSSKPVPRPSGKPPQRWVSVRKLKRSRFPRFRRRGATSAAGSCSDENRSCDEGDGRTDGDAERVRAVHRGARRSQPNGPSFGILKHHVYIIYLLDTSYDVSYLCFIIYNPKVL